MFKRCLMFLNALMMLFLELHKTRECTHLYISVGDRRDVCLLPRRVICARDPAIYQMPSDKP